MQIQRVGIVGCSNLAAMIREKIENSGIRAVFVETSGSEAADLSVLQNCEFVIEVVPEQLSDKIRMLQEIEKIVPPGTPLATTVSSLSVTEIASSLRNPDRLVGLHFFIQANRDKLVEVVRSLQCLDTPFLQAYELMKAIGQVPVRCKDVPGFLVQRLFVPYMNHAIQSYDDGLATREDFDAAVELGLGYPMGPLKLADVIGVDDYLSMAGPIFQELPDTKYATPPLVSRMVKAGYLGLKTGKGFYDYQNTEPDKE